MAEPAPEPDLQTLTVVGKVLVSDDSTALLLGLLGFSSTKLWNAAMRYTKERWESTGKIPTYADIDIAIKQERPLWYRRLHSQSAQAVLEELWQSYRSRSLSVRKAMRRNRPATGGKPTYRQ